MREYVMKYIDRQYYINVEESDVRRKDDDSIIFLAELLSELIGVFGLVDDCAFIFITDWVISNGLDYKTVLNRWKDTPILEAGYVFAPYTLTILPPTLIEDEFFSPKIDVTHRYYTNTTTSPYDTITTTSPYGTITYGN